MLNFTKISRTILLVTGLVTGISFHSTGQAEESIEINTGASSAPIYAVGPIYMSSTLYYKYSRFAYLYTQDELEAAGINEGSIITSLGWMKSTSSSAVGPATFNIYMKNSNATAYSNASESWSNLSAGTTLVYNNASQSIPATASPAYIDFALNTPFVYTGGSIEILTEWNAASAASPLATGSFEWVNTTVVDRIYGRGDASLPTTLSSTQNNVSMDDKRPVIQFKIESTTCLNLVDAGPVSVSPSNTICPNTDVTLDFTSNDAGLGVSYQWESSTTNGAGSYTSMGSSQTTPTITAQPTQSTWYRCKVVCSEGTTDYTDPVQVIIDVVNVDLGSDTSICEGDTDLVLDAENAGSTFLWNDGITDQTRTITTAGTYTVTVTSAAGCTATSTITVDYLPAASGDFTTNETTNGTIVFDATAANTESYFWELGVNNVTATGASTTYTYPDNGTYTVTLNLINECGDTTKVTKVITVSTSTVGLVELEDNTTINVYPNPAKDVLFIANEGNAMIESIHVIDIFGKTISSTTINASKSNHSLNIKDLKAGTYYLKLQTPQGLVVKAFNVLN